MDIIFFENNGKEYQKIGTGEIFPVNEGEIEYKFLKRINNYHIKYNLNGLYGYSIFKKDICLKNKIWSLDNAIKLAMTM